MNRAPRSSAQRSEASPISYRLDAESLECLVQRAAKLGISRNLLARHYLLEILQEREERIVLREAVTHLQGVIATMVENLSLSVEVLLAQAGRINPKEAADWVDQNLDTD